jgi:hypothetical protein
MATAYKNREGVWVVSEKIEMNRYDLEGSIDTIKTALDLVRERATAMGMVGEGTVDISVTNSYYDSYDMEVEYYFVRYENDKERDRRLANEALLKDEAKAKRKEAAAKKKLKADPEYAEFERLKAKFSG